MLILKQRRCKAELFSIVKTTFCVLTQGQVGKCRMIFLSLSVGDAAKVLYFSSLSLLAPSSQCVCVCVIPASSCQFLIIIQYTTNQVKKKKKTNTHLGTPVLKVDLGVLLHKGCAVISVAFQWSTNVTCFKRQDELVDKVLGFSPLLNTPTTECFSLKSFPFERL